MTPNSRSYITQFNQPDTLVPSPGKAVAWNRYAYADWNPIRYSDPTGHAAIENTGFGGGDFTKEMISKSYSNVKAIGGGWTSDRLRILYLGTAIAARMHGGPANFKKAVGDYSVANWGSGSLVTPGKVPVLGRTMILSNSDLDYKNIHTVIHETGHVFDFNNTTTNITRYPGTSAISVKRTRFSDLFISTFSPNSGCDEGSYLGCVNPYPEEPKFNSIRDLYGTINFLSQYKPNLHYSPEGDHTTYGDLSSIDDMADSYADTAMTDAGFQLTDKKIAGPNRMMIIHVIVDLVNQR